MGLDFPPLGQLTSTGSSLFRSESATWNFLLVAVPLTMTTRKKRVMRKNKWDSQRRSDAIQHGTDSTIRCLDTAAPTQQVMNSISYCSKMSSYGSCNDIESSERHTVIPVHGVFFISHVYNLQ